MSCPRFSCLRGDARCHRLTRSSSAAASPAWRPRTSCRVTGSSFVVLEGASRAGGVILSEEIDGYTIDGGPDALLVQKPDGITLCEELGLGDRLIPTKPPRLAFIQRGGRLHPLPAASVLGIPTRARTVRRARGLFSWAGKLRMGAELFVPPAARRGRRIDRRVHDAALRRRGHDLPRRAAARRHSRRRRRSVVGAGAVSAARRGRAEARQPAPRVPVDARAARRRVRRRRVPVAARRTERDGARAGRALARGARPARTRGVSRGVTGRRRAFVVRTPSGESDRRAAPWSWRRRRT